MSHMIDDNRFVLIEKYKQKLIEGTNISDRPEEMAVIDSILFRLWQMGWLDKLEQSEPHWIPVTERLPENDNDVLVQMCDDSMMVDSRTASSNGWFWADLGDEPIAWMPLPEPYKGVAE